MPPRYREGSRTLWARPTPMIPGTARRRKPGPSRRVTGRACADNQLRAGHVRLPSWTLQEPPIKRREYQDDSDVYEQSLPEVVPEEQDVHADHDGYQPEHVKHGDCRPSHRFVLLCATEWS